MNAIQSYETQQRELEAERVHDMPQDDVQQPDAANFCADEYEEEPDLVWLERLVFCVAFGAALWTAGMWVTP